MVEKLKKYLIFSITLLISIFIFNNNVKALDKSNLIVQTSSISYDYIKSHPEEYTQIGKATNGAYAYLYKDHSILTITTTWDTTRNIGLAGFSNASGNIQNISIINLRSSMRIYLSVGDGISIVSSDYAYCNSDTFVLTQSTPSSNTFYYEFFEAGTKITSSSMINDKSLYYTSYDLYRNNSLYVSKNNEYIHYVNVTEINITKKKEEEITLNNGVKVIINNLLKINFTTFDKNKYKYLYSFDKENWYTIDENDFNLVITKNKTIYVKVNDLNDNYITSATFTTNKINEHVLDYSIEDGTEQGKKLKIYYYNFDNTDYHIVSNFQTGKEEKFESNINGTIIYDNLNLDNTYSINSYNENDEFIVGKVIDIQVDEAKLNNNRYIKLNLDKEKKRINFYYENYKKNDKCYYKISNEEEIEVNCSDNMLLNINKNGYIEIYIKNNNEIVLKRGVNLNFLDNLPKFKFDSYYNDNESKQVLKIIIDNLKSNDKIYYSFDKESWIQLENKRINYLDFYSSMEVYFKVERENEIVSEAYFDLVFKAFENSSENNDKEKYNGLKGLLKYFKEITNNITTLPVKMGQNIYLLIRKSKIGLYILLIIVSSIIILFLKSIKR